MKRLSDHLAFYASHHRDPRNRVAHYIAVPVMVTGLAIPLAMIKFSIFGVVADLSVVGVAAITFYYLCLDAGLAIGAGCGLAVLAALAHLAIPLGPIVGLGLAATIIAFGWTCQMLGHVIEVNRPAVYDDWFQAFIAPIFLASQMYFALGWKSQLKNEVERRVAAGDFAGVEKICRVT